jgi:hypothetical protein
MNLFLFCLFVLGAATFVNKLTNVGIFKKKSRCFEDKENDAKIEVGYPGNNSRTLHINSSIESSLPNHNFTNKELSILNDENDNSPIKGIYTVNMFVESHYELSLSLFERDLTKQMVNEAYEKLLNDNMTNIRNGIPEVFNIENKKKARDYLIEKLKL